MKKLIMIISLIALGGCDREASHQQEASGAQTLSGSASASTDMNPSIERLFLQQLSASGVIIKWRGAADKVSLGKEAASLDIEFPAMMEDGHQIAHVTGLEADTDYYYALGDSADVTQTYRFRTAPKTGSSPTDGIFASGYWVIPELRPSLIVPAPPRIPVKQRRCLKALYSTITVSRVISISMPFSCSAIMLIRPEPMQSGRVHFSISILKCSALLWYCQPSATMKWALRL